MDLTCRPGARCSDSMTCGDCVGPSRNTARSKPSRDTAIKPLGCGWYQVGDEKIRGREAAEKAAAEL